MQILFSIGTVGASPKIDKILQSCDFLTVLAVVTFFPRFCAQSNGWTDFHALWLKRRVSTHECSFSGVIIISDHIWGKYAPKDS